MKETALFFVSTVLRESERGGGGVGGGEWERESI
jgi:hypothetical protein